MTHAELSNKAREIVEARSYGIAHGTAPTFIKEITAALIEANSESPSYKVKELCSKFLAGFADLHNEAPHDPMVCGICIVKEMYSYFSVDVVTQNKDVTQTSNTSPVSHLNDAEIFTAAKEFEAKYGPLYGQSNGRAFLAGARFIINKCQLKIGKLDENI